MLRMMTGLVLALLCLLQPAAADGIGGWPLLHWGMTRQQVEQAYPNFADYQQTEPFPNQQFGLTIML